MVTTCWASAAAKPFPPFWWAKMRQVPPACNWTALVAVPVYMQGSAELVEKVTGLPEAPPVADTM